MTGSTPLAFNLLAFDAVNNNGTIKIKWNSIEEETIASYAVEKSYDAKEFFNLQDNIPGNKSVYEIEDKITQNNTLFYRLKIKSIDGKISYSHIAKVVFNSNYSLELYPNPVEDYLKVSFGELRQNGVIKVFTVGGDEVLSTDVAIGSDKASVATSSLSKGTYVVVLMDEEGNKFAKTFQKK